jgi:hypothetical protein
MTNPHEAFRDELHRVQAAVDATFPMRAPYAQAPEVHVSMPAPPPPYFLWHARAIVFGGPGRDGEPDHLVNGIPCFTRLEPRIGDLLARRLTGMPLRCYRYTADDGCACHTAPGAHPIGTWVHPHAVERVHPDAIAGMVRAAWPDGAGIMAELRLWDASVHRALLGIAGRGSLATDATLSVTMLWRGHHGQGEERNVLFPQDVTIPFLDLCAIPARRPGAQITRFIRQDGKWR